MPFLAAGFLSAALLFGAFTTSSREAAQRLQHGCPRGEDRPSPSFVASLVRAKQAVYGERFNIQGTAYVASARNTQLVAVMLVEDLSLVPGMHVLYAKMRGRCGRKTPYAAWAFSFHRTFEIVPDYEPVFVALTSRGWYVF